MRCRRFAIGFVLATALAALSAADTLYLRDGEQHPGTLKRMDAGRLWFDTADGVLAYPKAEVLKVQLQRARQYDDVETVAQITDPDLKACLEALPGRDTYPAAGYVTLLHRQTLDLRTEGVVKETVRHIALILQQRGEDVATTNVWYFEDADEPQVDFALTVTPEGRVLHLSDAALKSESLYSRLPEYQRLARLRFACKEPRPGSVIDVQYTVLRKRGGPFEPVFLTTVFNGEEPIERKEVVVRTPEGKPRILTSDLYAPEPVVAAPDGPAGTWRLTAPRHGLPTEPFMPPLAHIGPTLTLAETATWEDLGEAYARALADLPPLTEALSVRAKELAAAGGAEAIHNFVARTVRTVPVPQWHFRIVPHDPNATAQRGIANELDKNALYWRMLEAAGLEAQFALVRSRDAGPWPANTPSLGLFNRSAVYIPSQNAFTSVESDVLPFDVLPGPLQGAHALVLPYGADSLRLTQQPGPDGESDATHFEAALSGDGTLALTVTYTANGNGQAMYRSLKDLDEQALRNQLTQLAAYLHPSAVLESYDVSELSDISVPPVLTLHCRIPEYAVKAGDELLMFTLPAVSYSAHLVGRPAREFGLFWDHVTRETTEGRITLPQGYALYSLPGNVTIDSGVAAYRARLTANDGTVAFEDAYTLSVDEAPASAYAGYKQCLERRAGLARQRIILTRTK